MTNHSINLYSIKDITTGTFGVIFQSKSDEIAKRSVAHSLTVDTDSLLSTYPAEYQLYLIGQFDIETGAVIGDVEYVTSVVNLMPEKEAA